MVYIERRCELFEASFLAVGLRPYLSYDSGRQNGSSYLAKSIPPLCLRDYASIFRSNCMRRKKPVLRARRTTEPLTFSGVMASFRAI